MSILITGGSGFIGSYTILELINERKAEKIVIYDLAAPSFRSILDRVGKEVIYVDGNILDFGKLLETIKKYDIKGIIHTSLLGNFKSMKENPMNCIATNFNGTLNVLELARINNLKVVYTSSGAVYGETMKPAKEIFPIRPGDMYGMIKATCELLGEQYAKTYDLDYVAVRLYFVYGQDRLYISRPFKELLDPPITPTDVLTAFVQQSVRGEALKFKKGGDLDLDFTYVKDAAHGVLLAYFTKKPPHRVYNISSGEAHSLKEIAQIINRYSGSKYVEIGSGTVEGWPPRPKFLDNTLARNELGYIPQFDIDKGLIEFYRMVKGHP
ncbi:MAG: NAD(P)-dependent oxidoreductase [Nitrososphaeria archaeon]